ncbi:MAG: threonine synthase [Lachnospiraceae bacterium]|nr:threonine synthase [Lachnospiraceae bacterium]
MRYISTRALRSDDPSLYCSASRAIIRGLAEDGGLYVPETIPLLSREELSSLPALTYEDTACLILGKYLDFDPHLIRTMVQEAYSSFDSEGPVAIRPLGSGPVSVLELWHGPSCAFKDMALQLLPRLLTASLQHEDIQDLIWILTATSGDTGKAALEGFKDVPGTRITVFYPHQGVSAVQEAQMVRQQGTNVDVVAIKGNFDDAQSAVKRLFSDTCLAERLAQKHILLSSANSINWGRLLPQIVYYVYTAVRLGTPEQPVDFSVPTGNFGDILAGYYAKAMGAPVGRLICASNANNVLTDFLTTGTYDRNRPFYKTSSPSMDILVSSNLERLLYLASGGDGPLICSLMKQLSDRGRYTVPPELLHRIRQDFSAGYTDDDVTSGTIRYVSETFGYLCDPHTAVAAHIAFEDVKQQELAGQVPAPMVILSTASPFKFPETVLKAAGLQEAEGFDALDKVSGNYQLPIPAGLASLRDLSRRFDKVMEPSELDSLFL